MPIAPGTRLGPYVIGSAIGAGGMGEVYAATDTRLDRTVAIKVLPAELASDPDPSSASGSSRAKPRDARRERFEREAKAIAALNHPHICTLHDVGHEAGTAFLVMEHLEGESLQDRLTRGPLPLDDALAIAIQIADALDKAHRAGITHRDLKPGNVFLVGKGSTGPGSPQAVRPGSPQAKLLDFGLAKLTDPSAAGDVGRAGPEPGREQPRDDQPTRLADSLTTQGTILGTFHYMSPEQLEGREADARSDIWAFGCVVHEMVTGEKAFDGASHASLSHAILGSDPPPLSASQPLAPRSLDHVVRRCLAKDPDDRWQTIRDVHHELRWIVEQRPLESGERSPVEPARAEWRRTAVVGAVSLVIGAALAAGFLLRGGETTSPDAVTRLQLSRSPSLPVGNPAFPQVGVSADGRTVVFGGRLRDEADPRLFVRPLDAEAATALPGTEEGFDPAFSPDGTWIAFRNLRELLKVPVSGGRPVALGRVPWVFPGPGLSWGENDWIYYAENTGQAVGGALLRVRASGGEPERLIAVEGGSVGFPQVVGDGRFVLFSFVAEGTPSWDQAQIRLLDSQTGDQRVLVEAGGVWPTVASSGHLLFVQDSRLLAAPFDRDRMMVVGAPLEVLDGIQYAPTSGTAQWALAGNGTLVFQSGASPGSNLTWADARGAVRAFTEEQSYYDPRLSPDGQAVAVEVLGGGDDIWVLDLRRGTQTKLSQGVVEDETPAWSTDGAWVAWSTNRDGERVIVHRRADGSGAEETLWSGQEHAHVSMYSPDGRSLLFEKQDAERNTDIWLLSLDGSGAERLLVGSPFNEWNARLSPDGRWLAYSSDETGVSQVYVQPFPALDSRTQISPSGGNEAVWSRDGRQLFYRGAGAVWSVSVGSGETFEAGIPERLFDDTYANKALTHTGYDVADDGRFLVLGRDSAQTEVMTVIQNWFSELRERVPVS